MEFKAFSEHEIEGPDLKTGHFVWGGTVRRRASYFLGCGEKIKNLCPSLELKRHLTARSEITLQT